MERNKTIDCMKGLAIIFMVVGHIHISALVDKFIYSFHMPLFFIVSGYLYHRRTVSLEYLKKKVKTLILPYFVFAGGVHYPSLYIRWN